jgi:phage terminase large subunit-like protein
VPQVLDSPAAILSAPPPEFLAAAELLAAREPDSAWRREARPEQLPPPGDWFIWLILGGRGMGKTWTGARWLAEQAQSTPGDYAVIGRSEQDTRETCLEGGSGLLGALGLRRDSREYRRGTGQIRLANGSTIFAYSAESPESTRGPNLSGVWCDELAAWRFLTQMWDETLMPAVRIGDPHVVVTTTPRPVPLLRELVSRDDGSVVITRGTTFDNAEHLSARALAEFRRYEGTRIGRQELLGELLDDVEGALWHRELIEPYRVARLDRGHLVRVAVAVDPAVTAGERSDETGIVVCAVDRDGRGYVLDDLTCKLPPDGWARQVVLAREKWGADRVVAEANNGGQLVETVLRTVDPSLPLTLVHASHGKLTRAEPIAAVYEQGKVSHVGSFPELEDQLCTWVPGRSGSPDRLDALVWAFTALQPGRVSVGGPILMRAPSRWPAVRSSIGAGGFAR